MAWKYIQVHHSWKKTAAHQLYSHSGYHIIQDPIKTSSTSIQLTCIFWPQYPTLPHKTSKILLVLSSSRRSLSFSPLSSADLPKWVKPGKPWKPRIQGRPPEVWDKNQELRPLVSCQNVGQTKGFEVLMCFIRSKKKHTHLHKSEIVVETYFFGPLFFFSEACFNAKPEILFRAPLQDLSHRPRVGGLLVTVSSHWPSIKGSPTGSWKTNRKCSKYREIGRVVGFVFWNAKDQFLWEPLGAAAVEVVWRMGQNGKRSGDWYRFWSLLVDILKMD